MVKARVSLHGVSLGQCNGQVRILLYQYNDGVLLDSRVAIQITHNWKNSNYSVKSVNQKLMALISLTANIHIPHTQDTHAYILKTMEFTVCDNPLCCHDIYAFLLSKPPFPQVSSPSQNLHFSWRIDSQYHTFWPLSQDSTLTLHGRPAFSAQVEKGFAMNLGKLTISDHWNRP